MGPKDVCACSSYQRQRILPERDADVRVLQLAACAAHCHMRDSGRARRTDFSCLFEQLQQSYHAVRRR